MSGDTSGLSLSNTMRSLFQVDGNQRITNFYGERFDAGPDNVSSAFSMILNGIDAWGINLGFTTDDVLKAAGASSMPSGTRRTRRPPVVSFPGVCGPGPPEVFLDFGLITISAHPTGITHKRSIPGRRRWLWSLQFPDRRTHRYGVLSEALTTPSWSASPPFSRPYPPLVDTSGGKNES